METERVRALDSEELPLKRKKAWKRTGPEAGRKGLRLPIVTTHQRATRARGILCSQLRLRKRALLRKAHQGWLQL